MWEYVISTLWVTYTPQKFMQTHAKQFTKQMKKWNGKRRQMGNVFYITVKELAKSLQSGVSLLKEPCVMCHLTLQYNETNLYIHIMLPMTSLIYES